VIVNKLNGKSHYYTKYFYNKDLGSKQKLTLHLSKSAKRIIKEYPEFADFIKSLSTSNTAGMSKIEAMSVQVPRQIANAHTIFSLGLAVLILPFLKLFDKLILKIIPDKIDTTEPEFKLKYINSAIRSSPAISLSIAKRETERMSIKVKKLLDMSLKPFFENDEAILKDWQSLENEADFLKENINNYLISVSSENSDSENLNSAFQIMYVAKELEMIADIVNTNIRSKAKKWYSCNIQFSEPGKVELETMKLKALKQISRSMELFSEVNLERVAHVKQKFKKYAELAEDFEKLHYERLVNHNEDSLASSEFHLEILSLLKAVNQHATNISRILISWDKDKGIRLD
jgi:phosphate:Na+ symporter